MKKIVLALAAVAALVLAALQAQAAEFLVPTPDSQGAVVGDSAKTYKNLYAVGGSVVIFGPTKGDLYVAGGNLSLTGDVEQDLVAAGGTIAVTGKIGGDARLAGGNINIVSPVGGDLVLAGGSIITAGSTSVGGDLAAGGGSISINGPVTGGAQIMGGQIFINNKISGDLFVRATQSLTFGPQAEVMGKVIYQGRQDAVVMAGAKVPAVVRQDLPMVPNRTGWHRIGGALFTLAFVIKLLAMILAALVAIKLFPKAASAAVERANTGVWANLGLGLLALFVTPIVAILLMATVIGFYLGLILLAVYFLALLFAGILAALALGEWVVGKLTKRTRFVVDWQVAVIGPLLLMTLSVIPILGWIFCLLMMLLGLGAVLRLSWNSCFSHTVKA